MDQGEIQVTIMAPFPSIVALPFDILFLICQQIHTAERQQDLAAISLVSRTCNAAATPWLYRSVKLAFSTRRSTSAFSLRSIGKTSYHLLVRDITILGHYPNSSHTTIAELKELVRSLPNLRRFSWKSGSSVPSSLRRVLQSHPRVKDVVSESNSICEERSPIDFEPGQAESDLAQCRHDWERDLPVKSVLDNVVDCGDLCFSGYQFPPGLASFDGIDFSTLRRLQLNSCTDLRFLFDSLLDKVSILKLKSLTIDQPKYFGASGRVRLEAFLVIYKGLEEIAFSNLGKGRQYMQTIFAQRATLKVLKLHEHGISDSKKHFVPWRLADAEIVDARRQHLQDVEDVTNIRRRCPELCHLVIDQKRIDLDILGS